jgi:hypothetical protein
MCVKNYIACVELWAGEDFEVIAVEVKGNRRHLQSSE